MLVATKAISIGEYELQAGDPITAEIEQALPPGRIQKLQAAGWVRVGAQDNRDLEERLANLELQVEVLQEAIVRLQKTRGPRAPENQEA